MTPQVVLHSLRQEESAWFICIHIFIVKILDSLTFSATKMETRGIFTFLLLATIISLQMGGGCSLIFENHVPKESAIPLDASQLNKKADLLSPNKLMSKEDRMARFLNQFRFKKGGRAALVDLLDYMNKPKLRKEDMASTSTVRDPAQVKPWSWEAMLYEEN